MDNDKHLEDLIRELQRDNEVTQRKLTLTNHYKTLLQQYRTEHPEIAEKVYVDVVEGKSDWTLNKPIFRFCTDDFSLGRTVELDYQEGGFFFECVEGRISYTIVIKAGEIVDKEGKKYPICCGGNNPIRALEVIPRTAGDESSFVGLYSVSRPIFSGTENYKFRTTYDEENRIPGPIWNISFGNEIKEEDIVRDCKMLNIPEDKKQGYVKEVLAEYEKYQKEPMIEKETKRYQEKGLRAELIPELRRILGIVYEKSNNELYVRVEELAKEAGSILAD